MAVLVTIVIVGLGLVQAIQERRSALDAGRARIAVMAALLAEHTGRLLDGADLAAREGARVFDAHGGRWDYIAASEQDHRRLRQLVASVDHLVAIWLTDEAGMPRLTSRSFPAPAIDTSDREHFQAQRLADHGAFVSPLLRSRVDGSTNVVLARRLGDVAGEFRGIVQSVIRPDRLANAYAALRQGEGGELMLFRRDGALLLRFPALAEETLLGAKRRDSPELAVTDVAGIGRVVSAFDAIERLEARTAVEPYGLIVSYGLPVVAVTAGWRDHVRALTIAALVALAGVWLAAGALAQRARRERRMLDRLEDHVAARTAELATALRQRDTLLLEINHRIKNNLQIVGSLLAVQARRQTNEDARRALGEARTRVSAIADLHKHLYQSDAASTIRLDRYLAGLCRDLASIGSAGGGAGLSCAGDAVEVPLDQAIPLALIVTELVTNAMKYAFPDGRDGRIEVTVRRHEGRLRLTVADDGAGMSEDRPSGDGLGMTLVSALAQQLQATVGREPTARGTTVVVDVPDTGPAAAA
jgi:two-component sensor histidine kinase